MTLGFLLLGLPGLEELEWGEIAERQQRELGVELSDVPVFGSHSARTPAVNALRAVDLAVELGGTRREHEERQPGCRGKRRGRELRAPPAMSRAEKCFRTIPRAGRTSLVSS